MSTRSIPVITIDGPSGSGKGTIGVLLANSLGWYFLDSGAIYRVLAWVVVQQDVSFDAKSDVDLLVRLAATLQVSFPTASDGQQRVVCQGYDITSDIRQEKYGIYASQLAALPQVRQALLIYQQNFLRSPGLVADGRDMGTVVFPDAALKLFLTASAEERAHRRWHQLQNKGITASLAEVLQDLIDRDVRDAERVVAPLKPAADAVIVDTTKLSVDEVLQSVTKQVNIVLGDL